MGKSATAGAASSANGHGPATSNGSRSTANGSHVTPNGKGHATDPADITPLRRFRVGKEKIAGIFDRLKSVLCDAQSFVGRASKALVDDDLIREQKEVSAFQSQVTGLAELLMRDNMKVVFVGQTSNGKSTVINAMLHDRILPSGIGHTTNCFISVEGTDSDIPFVISRTPEGVEEKRTIEYVSTLADATHPDGKGNTNDLLRVCWPKSKCSLLEEDVVLMDSPGLDIDADFDEWIDSHCSDADVFVLVANCESILRRSESNFLVKVNEKFSKPNVFIVQNRWDAADNEPEASARIKQQHVEYAGKLLVEKLQVLRKDEINDRVFFVSAKEMLQLRKSKQAPPSQGNAPGDRASEFTRFERTFEECISRSALKTRFEHRVVRGLHVAHSLSEAMGRVADLIAAEKGKAEEAARSRKSELDDMRGKSGTCVRECETVITTLIERLRADFGSAMEEEIEWGLPRIVRDFDGCMFRPQSPDGLATYKKMLTEHVADMLRGNMDRKCRSRFGEEYGKSRNRIAELARSLLPGGVPHSARDVLLMRKDSVFEELFPPTPSSPSGDLLHISLEMNCGALSEGFREDIRFRFSLGWSVIGPKLLGPNLYQLVSVVFPSTLDDSEDSDVVSSSTENDHAGTGSTDGAHISSASNRQGSPPATPVPRSSVVAVAAAALAPTAQNIDRFAGALSSPPAYAALTVCATLLARPFLWKIVFAGAACVGGLYAWERVTYTNRAKERKYKEQYVGFVTKRLRSTLAETGGNVCGTIRRDLSYSLEGLKNRVSRTDERLEADIARYERDLAGMAELSSDAKEVHEKCIAIATDLAKFQDAFIQQ